MSDRKYRQRGYQDEPKTERQPHGPKTGAPAGRSEPVPREMRAPNMPGFREVVRCGRCGDVLRPPITDDSRCARCGADLHACAQCAAFDPGSRFECMKPIPARVAPKDVRNACTLFEPRVTVERETKSAAPPDARKAFDDLFK